MTAPETQHWPSVVAAMKQHAIDINDALLSLIADQVDQVVDTHWDSSSGGCGRCYGDVALSDSWDNAQSIILTWLMQKAGLS